MPRKITIPGIPDTSAIQDQEAKRAIDVMKETIEIREGRRGVGNKNERFVTVQDLIDAGIVADGKL
jgi:hypothetical protein